MRRLLRELDREARALIRIIPRVRELERTVEDLRARIAELDTEGGARLDGHLRDWSGGVSDA